MPPSNYARERTPASFSSKRVRSLDKSRNHGCDDAQALPRAPCILWAASGRDAFQWVVEHAAALHHVFDKCCRKKRPLQGTHDTVFKPNASLPPMPIPARTDFDKQPLESPPDIPIRTQNAAACAQSNRRVPKRSEAPC